TGSLSSVVGSSTVAAPAQQKLRAVIGRVSTIAAIPDNGHPTAKDGDSAPSQVVSFTSAPGADQTSAPSVQEESNTRMGTHRTPATVFGLPFGKASTDLEPSFWLD